MSLRWRIMGSTVLVVVLTVLTSVGVGYYATQSRLGVFVDRIGSDEAVQLARNLSREYTAAGGWETVDRALSEAGYNYDGGRPEEQGHAEGAEQSLELFHNDRVRVVVVSMDGRVVRDNLSKQLPGTTAPSLDGHRETVFDLAAGQPVGHVYMDVNHEFLSSESQGFLKHAPVHHRHQRDADGRHRRSAGHMVVQADHTSPVTALTEANPGHCQGIRPICRSASSDELGKMSAKHSTG